MEDYDCSGDLYCNICYALSLANSEKVDLMKIKDKFELENEELFAQEKNLLDVTKTYGMNFSTEGRCLHETKTLQKVDRTYVATKKPYIHKVFTITKHVILPFSDIDKYYRPINDLEETFFPDGTPFFGYSAGSLLQEDHNLDRKMGVKVRGTSQSSTSSLEDQDYALCSSSERCSKGSFTPRSSFSERPPMKKHFSKRGPVHVEHSTLPEENRLRGGVEFESTSSDESNSPEEERGTQDANFSSSSEMTGPPLEYLSTKRYNVAPVAQDDSDIDIDGVDSVIEQTGSPLGNIQLREEFSNNSLKPSVCKIRASGWIHKINVRWALKFCPDFNFRGMWVMAFRYDEIEEEWLKACALYKNGGFQGIHSILRTTYTHHEYLIPNKSEVSYGIFFVCGPFFKSNRMKVYGTRLVTAMNYRSHAGLIYYKQFDFSEISARGMYNNSYIKYVLRTPFREYDPDISTDEDNCDCSDVASVMCKCEDSGKSGSDDGRKCDGDGDGRRCSSGDGGKNGGDSSGKCGNGAGKKCGGGGDSGKRGGAEAKCGGSAEGRCGGSAEERCGGGAEGRCGGGAEGRCGGNAEGRCGSSAEGKGGGKDSAGGKSGGGDDNAGGKCGARNISNNGNDYDGDNDNSDSAKY